jgi:hypothetical protein
MHYFMIVLLLLAGCAATPGNGPDRGRLDLLAPLIIPPGEASARLQYGHPVARNAVREYDPFCVFEIDTVSDSPQTVRPDSFRILQVTQSIDTIAALPYPALIKVGMSGNDLPSNIYYKTRFTLRSEQQSGARTLTCLSNQHMPGVYPFMRFLTLEEMRGALGNDFRLAMR